MDELRQQGRDVTFENIREAIRSTGVSISANTIKCNQLAYDIYLANCRKPRTGHLPQPALRELVGSLPPGKTSRTGSQNLPSQARAQRRLDR